MPTRCAVVDDPENKSQASLVAVYDLLGFGELLAASGGTLDSVVGRAALKRIEGLRRAIREVVEQFPQGTSFLHLNDMLMAHLPVDLEVTPSLVEPGAMGIAPPSRGEFVRVLGFLSAAAALHVRSVKIEDAERLGPGGRTFVVLGKRWELLGPAAEGVVDVAPLQANLAFAEAYLADKAGSAAGFSHSSWSRMYINDHLQAILVHAGILLHPEELEKLGGSGVSFPKSLETENAKPVRVVTFHRDRYDLQHHG